MASFTLSILTPGGLVYEGPSESVIVPTLDGYAGVMANHAAMVSALGHGYIMSRDESGQKWFWCVGGVMEVVRGSAVQILADEAGESASQEEAAERAKKEHAEIIADIPDDQLVAH